MPPNPLLRPAQVLCKLALLPLLSPSEGISKDTGYYRNIARVGDLIQRACVSPLNASPRGGHSRAGDNNRLLLVLYARNSDFDNKVRRRIALGHPVLGLENAVGDIVYGTGSDRPDDDDATSSTGPPVANPAPNAPSCGQYCWGPGGPCDGADGCRCLADAWQGVGSALFTGRCQLPYRLSGSFYSGAAGRELLATAAAAAGGGLNSTGSNSTRIVSVAKDSANAIALTVANMACPCNCTYVSRACCRSATGTVYETPRLKLGALKAPNSSLVCDGATGRFRSITLN